MYGNPVMWNALLAGGRTSRSRSSGSRSRPGSPRSSCSTRGRGAAGPEDYRAAVLPHTSDLRGLAGTGGPDPLRRGDRGAARHDGRGRRGRGRGDWRVPLDEAVRRVEHGKALQGDLDPAILLAPWEVIERRAKDVLGRGRAAEGHVFKLGHGVLPDTNPDVLARLTDLVHEESARLPG